MAPKRLAKSGFSAVAQILRRAVTCRCCAWRVPIGGDSGDNAAPGKPQHRAHFARETQPPRRPVKVYTTTPRLRRIRTFPLLSARRRFDALYASGWGVGSTGRTSLGPEKAPLVADPVGRGQRAGCPAAAKSCDQCDARYQPALLHSQR